MPHNFQALGMIERLFRTPMSFIACATRSTPVVDMVPAFQPTMPTMQPARPGCVLSAVPAAHGILEADIAPAHLDIGYETDRKSGNDQPPMIDFIS
jgi:hypothetical protein